MGANLMSRECMLKEVMALDFAAYDLALYLDTHPCCEQGLCLYQELSEKAKEMRAKYEEVYGPLSMESGATDCKWKWVENPWPWERMV